jgi:hypothetical protein
MNNNEVNGFIFENLYPDYDLKEFLINELVTISQRDKYIDIITKIKENPLDKSFLKAINYIEDKSMDITQNYTCAPIIGISLANEYGENARGCFHKICKNNTKYNADTCDKEYSKYLKVDSVLTEMVPFYYLYAEGIIDELNTLINEREKLLIPNL